jgi:hypothetical protein
VGCGMLDRYPNFYVDIGARIAELGRQPRATRRLVLSHQTRVLFRTAAFQVSKAVYRTYFGFLDTDDEDFAYGQSEPPLTGRWRVSGVELPSDVLIDVYDVNAMRLIPALRAP